MKYYLGIDIGTSSTKAVCFAATGKMMTSATEEYELTTPKPGYAEESPLDWWDAVRKVIQSITKQGYIISGIGLSGQMHGLVLLDEKDQLLRDSIIWCDNRAVLQAEELQVVFKNQLKRITGNDAVAAFTLAKLLWVKENEPDLYKKINKIMLPKDYIRYCLTKEFKTEYSDASGMQMLDIQKKCFSKEILDFLNLRDTQVPQLIESAEISGFILPELATELGLPKDCFVVGGAGDQAAAALGSGIINKGDVSIVLGSSGVVFSPINKEDLSSNQMQVFMHAVSNTYHIMGVTNGCGLSYKWFHENICKEPYDSLNEMAESVEPLSSGVQYLPYLNGERTPIMDPYASGVFLGIRQNTQQKELTRAVLEGISYSLKDCFLQLPKADYHIRISGGGAKSLLWRKMIASMLGASVERIEQSEGGALGVAMLAMVANKEYQSLDEAAQSILKVRDVVEPDEHWSSCYETGFKLYKKAYNCLKEYYKMAFAEGGKK